MNVQNVNSGLIRVRYIISLSTYYQTIDSRMRTSAGIWVNGPEHLYKMALFILSQAHTLPPEAATEFIKNTYAYLQPVEQDVVCSVIWALVETMRINLLPLLANSGASLQSINLVSIEEQIVEDSINANGIFIFSYPTPVNPNAFRTIHPIIQPRPGIQPTVPQRVY